MSPPATSVPVLSLITIFATTVAVGFFRYVTGQLTALADTAHTKIVTPTATIT